MNGSHWRRTLRNKREDLETLQHTRPYLRTLMAFLLEMRYSVRTTDQNYKTADKYLDNLQADVEAKVGK